MLFDLETNFNENPRVMLGASCSQAVKVQPNMTIFPLSEFRDLGTRRVMPGSAFRIGLLIPMCGSAGIWGPSCISSAQLAVAELNNGNGMGGRPIELIVIDSALEAPTPIEEAINSLIKVKAIDAIVGMHISTVRQNLSKIIKQRVPYVYTPLYEGGERTRGIFAIGDTPEHQLGPALEYFHRERKVKCWALIGNDYVWPRASNDYAKRKLKALGSNVALERYLPFGISDMLSVVTELESSGADAVLISLVGQDAVTFNRAFGTTQLHEKMLRLSCAIEENGLLASGAENLIELYSAASYFGSMDTSANNIFKEKYYGIHGENAPVLNALGQSTYEGVQFLAGLLAHHQDDWQQHNSLVSPQVTYRSIRREEAEGKPQGVRPIYLARANGVLFDIMVKL